MSDLPAAVQRLQRRAEDNGWTVTIKTAQDRFVAVWLRRNGEQLAAAWDSGKFSSAWQAWKPNPQEGGVSPKRIGSRQLMSLVTS